MAMSNPANPVIARSAAVPGLDPGKQAPSREHRYFVYLPTNRHHTILYIVVTNDLLRRVHEHRTKLARGFTARYNVDKLVYFEETADVRAAITQEKQIKGGSRERQIALVNAVNPDWRDRFADWVG